MKNFFSNDLLPEGFKVLLPDKAHKEENISRIILDSFFKNGYLLVKTPIIEYEDNTSQNYLKSLNNDSFILIEPETKKVLVLRTDITPQVAKLACTKLKHYPRPIRLTYSGEVIRNSKNNYNSERQFRQIGAELIGGSPKSSLQEILQIAISTLSVFKIRNITIDFSLPAISRLIDKNLNLKIKSNKLIKEALDNKDSGVIKNKKYNYINGLILLSGTIEKARKDFKKFKFPKNIEKLLKNFFSLSLGLQKKFNGLSITVDITEGKSFLEYNNFGFKIYNKSNAQPIALGGDYKSNDNEFGLGITFLVSHLVNSISYKKNLKVYVPYSLNASSKKLNKSIIVIKELFPGKNALKEAKKHDCDYMLNKNGQLKKVK